MYRCEVKKTLFYSNNDRAQYILNLDFIMYFSNAYNKVPFINIS